MHEAQGATLKIAFGQTPLGDLWKILRGLIPLVCPKLSRCLTEVEIIKTYMTAALADRLKAFAGE